MKELRIILILIFISTYVYSQNDILEINLEGNIMSIKTITYEAKGKTQEIRKGERVGMYDRFCKYNVEGKPVYENQFNKFDSIKLELFYEYNKNGYRIEVKHLHIDESLNFKNKYCFDDKGKQIKGYFYKSDSLITISTHLYNTKGERIKTIRYNAEGIQIGESISKYNSKSELIEHVSLDTDSNVLFQFFYEYDKNGNKTYYKENYVMFSLNAETFYKYSKKGNLIEKEKYNYKKLIISKQSYSYKYDKHDNWIFKIVYENTIPISIFERKIEYY